MLWNWYWIIVHIIMTYCRILEKKKYKYSAIGLNTMEPKYSIKHSK